MSSHDGALYTPNWVSFGGPCSHSDEMFSLEYYARGLTWMATL